MAQDKIIFQVGGMSCGHCVASIQEAVAALPGVQEVEVSLEQGTAAVIYDAELLNPEMIADAILDQGFELE